MINFVNQYSLSLEVLRSSLSLECNFFSSSVDVTIEVDLLYSYFKSLVTLCCNKLLDICSIVSKCCTCVSELVNDRVVCYRTFHAFFELHDVSIEYILRILDIEFYYAINLVIGNFSCENRLVFVLVCLNCAEFISEGTSELAGNQSSHSTVSLILIY